MSLGKLFCSTVVKASDFFFPGVYTVNLMCCVSSMMLYVG